MEALCAQPTCVRGSLLLDALFIAATSVSKIFRLPAKNVTRKTQPEFNVKQLFRVIQGHAFGDYRKAVKGLYILYMYIS